MNILSVRTICALLLLTSIGCGGGSDSDTPDGGTPDSNACDVFGLTPRIVSGTQCGGTSPVVRITINSSIGTSFCTGTMITPNKVLTAVHCVSDETFTTPVSPSGVTVSLADTTAVAARAKRIIINTQAARDLSTIATAAVQNGDDVSSDSFNITQYIQDYGLSDIAVIELANSLNLPTVQIRASSFPTTGTVLSIFGYGTTNPDVPSATLNLYSGEMKLSATGVKNLFAAFDGTGSDTCSGDSGGPIIVREEDGTYSIVGTTLGGSERCAAGDIAIFTATAGSGIGDFLRAAAPEATYR